VPRTHRAAGKEACWATENGKYQGREERGGGGGQSTCRLQVPGGKCHCMVFSRLALASAFSS
jgi:hypothetical protein